MHKLFFINILNTIGVGIFLLLSTTLSAQTPVLYGIVTDENSELLVGATVAWVDKSAGTTTNVDGEFRLPAQKLAAQLTVQYVGFQPVTIEVQPSEDSIWVELKGVVALAGVTIAERNFGNSVSTLSTRNVESISSKELRKAPCCNLSESFETNGAVDVAYSNALTGVKEIQMLGLRGVYSQLLVENRPTLGGIATPFALEMIPGTWLDGIVLAKGASTVKQGNAGIAGQINADLVKPMFDKPLFVNAFTSSEGRGELNVHLNRKKKVTANGLLLHGSFVENQWDMNRDRFYDMPNRQQLNGLYRWQYDGPAGCAQFNVQGLTDRRQSGQFRLQEGQTTPLFAVNQQNDRVEMWGKYGKEGIGGKPYQQLGNIVGASWHRVNSQFGPNAYNATQQSAYFQTLFQGIIGNTNHLWVVAPSVQYDDIQEQVNEQDLSRRETQAGAMLEYTYSRPNLHLDIPDLVVVAGARLDWNTRFQRWMFTPRVSAKYNFTTESVVRLSAGRGFRSPNLIAENLSLLASNRRLDFEEGLSGQARNSWEEAWNYGVNYTHNFQLAHRKSSASIDLYRTDFVRQVLVDVDQSPTTVYFYQVPGKSFANSVLATMQTEVLPGFDVKLAYKWQDVQATYNDGVVRRAPLLPRHRGLVTLDYTTPSQRWMFNLRTQIVGPQRLPDNSQIPHELTHDFPEVSPTYALLSGQVTRRFNPKFEMYLGGENLGNFQQHHAIIAANDPGSAYFNGSQLWAPMGGAIVNLGLRYAPSGL